MATAMWDQDDVEAVMAASTGAPGEEGPGAVPGDGPRGFRSQQLRVRRGRILRPLFISILSVLNGQ